MLHDHCEWRDELAFQDCDGIWIVYLDETVLHPWRLDGHRLGDSASIPDRLGRCWVFSTACFSTAML